jgi:hypothetical protein
MDVQLVKPVEGMDLTEWYKEHGLSVDKDGIFTAMPYNDGPVTRDTILEQVATNAARRYVPNLHTREYTKKIMVYVGGGTTLEAHLDEVKAKCEDERYDVFTSNKTCAYLVDKGVIPNYHLILDPTEKKVKDLEYEANVPMVLGLQCHPRLFDRANELNRQVVKFLAASITNVDGKTDRDAALGALHADDPEIMQIGGGSMCGTRMMFFAAARGYRRLEYYGFDGCIRLKEGGVINCYSYFKPRGENIIEYEAGNGRTFDTTITLSRQAEELTELLDNVPGLDVEIYGDSLLSNHLAIYRLNRPQQPYRISPEYLELQKQMHDASPRYARSGGNHAARVFMAAAQIAKKRGECSVLDYGSGQGTLLDGITRAFPDIPGVTYREYDPCIQGKDTDPESAGVVFCGDVMEHVEPECVEAVIKHIHYLTKEIAIVVVSTRPAHKNLPDGRNAHICLQKPNWWASWFRKYFVVIEQNVTDDAIMLVMQKIPT